MKRLVLGLVVIVFSVQAIGCDQGGGGTTGSPAPAAGSPAAGSPAAGTPAKGAGAVKSYSNLANPDGPKNDR